MMMNNRAELLVNIIRRAPWLIKGGEDFFPELVSKNAKQNIEEMRDNQLTIICESGNVYRQKLGIKILNNNLKIDKPTHWDEPSDTFYLFFRARDKTWNFFLVENSICYPSFFSAPVPDKIYTMQKRKHCRIRSSVLMQ